MEKLNALRKQKIRAVILLEAKILQKEEVLRVAKMALQTGQNQVSINGVEIQVFSSEKGLEVYHGSEQLLAIKEP